MTDVVAFSLAWHCGEARSGIYAIVNTTNGRRYIGSSIHIAKRWKDHAYELRRGKHANKFLQNAWNKHGQAAFVCLLVEAVAPTDLLTVEQRHIESNAGGYNICLTAGKPPAGSQRGKRMPEELKWRLASLRRGQKLSPEVRERMRDGQRRRRVADGTAHHERPESWHLLTKGEKIRLAKTGRQMSADAREKNRRARLGKPLSAAHRERLRQAQLAHHAKRRAARQTGEVDALGQPVYHCVARESSAGVVERD